MKRLAMLILTLILLFVEISAEEAAHNELIDEYAKIYGAEINNGTSDLEDVDLEKLVPGFDASEIVSGLARGESIFSVREILGRGLDILAGEVRQSLKIMIFVFAIGVLCTYLTNIQSSMQNHGAANAAFFVCYLVIAGIVAAAFVEVVGCGRTVISNLSVFMRTMVPVALVTLAASGAAASATTFELIVMGVIEAAEWLLESFFVPLILMTAALGIVNNISENINAQKLVQFLGKVSKWGIGIVMTLFVGVMGLQGLVSGSADGLTVKVTKFAASNLIPLVGGALAETVETVMNCSVVIKNAVGVLGIVVVILIVSVPALKVAACLIMFRLCAAVLQPISDKRIVKCISELADSISNVFGMIMVVSVMFIIMLTIIINVGSTVALLGR